MEENKIKEEDGFKLKRKEKDAVDYFFEKFSDPNKLKQKRVKREKKIQEVISYDKKLASEWFNEAPDRMQLQFWKRYTSQIPTLETLQALMENASLETIGYKPLDRIDGIYSVLNFITCADYCTAWLELHMRSIGWKDNMTNYHPIAVCHSTNELLAATLEAYKMSIKQMMWIVRLSTH